MKLFYTIYFLGIAVFVLNSVSYALFKKSALKHKIRAQALSENKSLVEWEAVQKWNGILPTYMLGGTTPFINVTPK